MRVQKMEQLKGGEALLIYRDIVDVLVHETAHTVQKAGFDAISGFAPEERQDDLIRATYGLCSFKVANVKDARRRIADLLIEENRYCF